MIVSSYWNVHSKIMTVFFICYRESWFKETSLVNYRVLNLWKNLFYNVNFQNNVFKLCSVIGYAALCVVVASVIWVFLLLKNEYLKDNLSNTAFVTINSNISWVLYEIDITPRIIAMGCPSEGTEGIYRNAMPEVSNFLKQFHENRFKVFNL